MRGPDGHCRTCHTDYDRDVEASGCCRRLHGWLPEVIVSMEVMVVEDITQIQKHARIVGVR